MLATQTPLLFLYLLDVFFDFSSKFNQWLSYTYIAVVLFLFVLGAGFLLFGLILWVTDRDKNKGRKALFKGVIFISLSLALGGFSFIIANAFHIL
ncbi:MAG: hypothetical protein K9W42_12085 [Candidatus Heimdallarchaeota archaeon]|nr:hypothetical protein [Candidatus Heimdallarchaeota archaeon]